MSVLRWGDLGRVPPTRESRRTVSECLSHPGGFADSTSGASSDHDTHHAGLDLPEEMVGGADTLHHWALVGRLDDLGHRTSSSAKASS